MPKTLKDDDPLVNITIRLRRSKREYLKEKGAAARRSVSAEASLRIDKSIDDEIDALTTTKTRTKAA